MTILKSISAALLVALLSGCGATSNISYIAPSVSSIKTNISVDDSKDAVWARLVKKLSENFFVINNLEKDSGLINVSFSSSTPKDYMTCGESTRYFENLRGKITYKYDPVESTAYSTTSGPTAYNVRRSSNLDGRANIYVSDTDSKTSVSVNVIYVANVTINAYDFVTGALIESTNYKFNATSKTPYVDDSIQCVSNGKVENMLISLVQS